MTLKTASIAVLIRDPEGNIIGQENAYGPTDDEGLTVVVPIGYLSNIQNAAEGDITVTIIPPPVINPPAVYEGRVDDVEAELSTITLSYPE